MNVEPVFVPLPRTAGLDLYLWMVEHGAALKDLSNALGVSEMSVSRWRNGSAKPGRYYAQKLERLTRGRITVASWDALATSGELPRSHT